MTSSTHEARKYAGEHNKKVKSKNPIVSAVDEWILSMRQKLADHDPQQLISSSPKRWTLYEPMVLLPSGTFLKAPWAQVLVNLEESDRSELWGLILKRVGKAAGIRATHLAINEGIPPYVHHAGGGAVISSSGQAITEAENHLRSPSGLRMLYGDFGPSLNPSGPVSESDFDAAFWVSTKQNGIYQTWAPRWTMFSRGNVKEKVRLLDFHGPATRPGPPQLPVLARPDGRSTDPGQLHGTWAADLYAGIGYFAFCYVCLGMRVLCWEINPWSVEGLRRGAMKNGWRVRVVQGPELGASSNSLLAHGDENIIVFSESNDKAVSRTRTILGCNGAEGLAIRHVNCGFLPSSSPTWNEAWSLVSQSARAWLHLHENVGAADVDARTARVQSWADEKDAKEFQEGQRRSRSLVEHVERVKTFAPGVWHCVFDVSVERGA